MRARTFAALASKTCRVVWHLKVGACALQNDSSASQDFPNLWEDTNPDIPILQQAKAEYAKLK